MIIKSTLAWLRCLLGPALMFVIFLAATAAFIVFAWRSSEAVLYLPALIFFIGSILFFRNYLLRIQRLSITSQGFELSSLLGHKKTMSWTEVKGVHFRLKPYAAAIWYTYYHQVEFRGKRQQDDLLVQLWPFKNVAQIVAALMQIKPQLKSAQTIGLKAALFPPHTHHYPDHQPLQKFSGNHLLTYPGFMLYGLLAFVAYLMVQNWNGDIEVLYLPVFPLLLFFLGFGYQLNYFYLGADGLFVRNHIWRWRKHGFKLEEIREIAFIEQRRLPTSLCVITRSYEVYQYPAGSLNKRKRTALLKALRSKGVKVKS